jgi:hypothetical protein
VEIPKLLNTNLKIMSSPIDHMSLIHSLEEVADLERVAELLMYGKVLIIQFVVYFPFIFGIL